MNERFITRPTIEGSPRSTWFITGTSSGFGRHLTELLLERGDTVAATVRRAAALDDLKALHGDRLWVRVLDVTDYPEINDLILAADVAVLDYSSLRFDFGLTGKPMIFLVPDLDFYTGGARGFLYDYRLQPPRIFRNANITLFSPSVRLLSFF